MGALWENFCIVERIKNIHFHRVFKNYYFWKTYNQKEIDIVEEYNGKLEAFEFKWNQKKLGIHLTGQGQKFLLDIIVKTDLTFSYSGYGFHSTIIMGFQSK